MILLATALEPGRQVLICRELTKKFEQLISIKANEITSWLETAESLKGEFIILVAGRQAMAEEAPEHASLLLWANALSPYLGSKEIAAVLSQALGLKKKAAYQIALDAKDENTDK
jgi:16S rRNA (cytidine1402-2'-O)-methyltransferase